MIFRDEKGQEFPIEVHDAYPDLGDIDVDGKWYVKVSVPMFCQMAARMGYTPVLNAYGEKETANGTED